MKFYSALFKVTGGFTAVLFAGVLMGFVEKDHLPLWMAIPLIGLLLSLGFFTFWVGQSVQRKTSLARNSALIVSTIYSLLFFNMSYGTTIRHSNVPVAIFCLVLGAVFTS